jgi:hypothetical protein
MNKIALLQGKPSMKVESDPRTSSVPPAPVVHFTAKDITYEVDVDVKSNDKQKEENTPKRTPDMDEAGSEGSRAFEYADNLDLSERVPITAREYGQARKGAASGVGFEASCCAWIAWLLQKLVQ